MTDVIRFAVLGLGLGAIYALAGQGIVVIYRGSGVINFALGAIGTGEPRRWSASWRRSASCWCCSRY